MNIDRDALFNLIELYRRKSVAHKLQSSWEGSQKYPENKATTARMLKQREKAKTKLYEFIMKRILP